MNKYILILAMLITGLTTNSLKAQGRRSLQTNPLRSAAISVYPNPNYGKFCIDLTNPPAKMQVTIYDISGKKTYESSIISPLPINEIDFTSHPKGVYFIKVGDGENSYTETIVIQ
jgi:hypothetical protein